MTVLEYLKFWCVLKKVPSEQSHIQELVEKAGLLGVEHRLTSQLSKGYGQRLNLAQALVGNPELLFLDEPTSGLDPKQISDIRNLIGGLKSSHTLLFSSHIISEVSQLCDHVMILHHGEVKLAAPLHQIQTQKEVTIFGTLLCSRQKVDTALLQLPPINTSK